MILLQRLLAMLSILFFAGIGWLGVWVFRHPETVATVVSRIRDWLARSGFVDARYNERERWVKSRLMMAGVRLVGVVWAAVGFASAGFLT
ncbi:MAG: hypothetical protein Q7T04_00465, partial [Dehalococcoidia bacterium]|nr:hypothetical protein [Dehalococcoidia bacterium]